MVHTHEEHYAKMKSDICRHIVCFDDSSLKDLPMYHEIPELIELVQALDDDMINVSICPHSEYLTTENVCRELVDVSREYGLKMHIHISETKFEVEGCKERHGKTPIKYFADLGVFNQGTIAAHCVYCEGDDVQILANKKG
ncbi:MAG: amidohydrolase family protein [Eggerthellaceae bacterium]|nr:amidohydrolase family protein [Eggerthellaceae bacterium]